ncbi:hypothetical protein VKS41_005057 [Umbelopsis sp. WA50703]
MSIHAASQYNATDVEMVEDIKVTERGNYYYVKWRNLEDRHKNSWVEEPFLLGSESLTRFHEKNASEALEERLLVRQPTTKVRMESQSDNNDDSDELDEIPLFHRARIRRRKCGISYSPETSTTSTSLISPLMSCSVTDESFLLTAGDKRRSKISKNSSKSDVHDKLTSSSMNKTRAKTLEQVPASKGLVRRKVSLPTMVDIERPTPPTTPRITASPKDNIEKSRTPTIPEKPLPQKLNETPSKETQETTLNNNPQQVLEPTPSESKSTLSSRKFALGESDSKQNGSQNFKVISKKFKARQSLKLITSPPPPQSPPSSTLWRGDIKWGEHKMLDLTIQPVTETVSLDRVRSALKELSSIEIKSFFSQQHLIEYITAPPTLLSLSFPIDSVRYGKLRNFLTINNAAALIPITLECSFAVVPYFFPLVAAATDSSNLSLQQALFLVCIKLPKPSATIDNDSIDSTMSVNFSSYETYDWNMVNQLYAVPKQIADMPEDKSIYIVSDHPDASKVQEAAQAYGYKIATKPTDPSIYAVLIHNELFPNALIPELLDLKRSGVHFFLYGYSGCEISTPLDQEIFPEHSGGLITMDAMDLVRQPDVLEQAIQNVDKLNAPIHSILQPQWQIVFREDIFRDIEKLGRVPQYKDR